MVGVRFPNRWTIQRTGLQVGNSYPESHGDVSDVFENGIAHCQTFSQQAIWGCGASQMAECWCTDGFGGPADELG